LNSGLSTDFGVQLKFWLSQLAQRKSKSKSEVTHWLQDWIQIERFKAEL